MSDDNDRLDVSLTATWTAEIPSDIDPESDLSSEEEVEQDIRSMLGLSRREEIVEWDLNIESEVTTDE